MSSSLLHMSGTFKTIGAANATCAAARSVTLLMRCNHLRVGQNLLMAGADLSGGTGTPAVSQRSESGQGILGAKEGRGIVAVLSSRMSAGGCSLAGRRDNVPLHNRNLSLLRTYSPVHFGSNFFFEFCDLCSTGQMTALRPEER